MTKNVLLDYSNNNLSEYGDYLPLNKLTVSYVFDNANRQPGWIFLISILKSFSNDFFVFQFVQAIFINYAISRTIVFNTKYIFTATLFYFVYLYTELNFEVMRESFAVGFLLFSLEAYKRNLWFKYYISEPTLYFRTETQVSNIKIYEKTPNLASVLLKKSYLYMPHKIMANIMI